MLLEASVRLLPLGVPTAVRTPVGIHEMRRLVCAHQDLWYGLQPDLNGRRMPA